MTELLVTYPAGSTSESSAVAALTRVDGQVLFAVGRTPCHPRSPRWPDQPEDRCTLERGGAQTPVQAQEGYLLGAELMAGNLPEDVDPAQALACVIHSIPAELAPAMGEEVTLRVDEKYRAALSRRHSRCPPASAVTIGQPCACASSVAMLRPSYRLVFKNTSNAL